MWLDQGVSEHEVRARLQARVPDFSLSPDPGGQWDWLLGVLALGISTGTLVLVTRRTVARKRPQQQTEEPDVVDFDDEMHWQDRLDDELLESEL